MELIPVEHVTDSHLMEADGMVELFEMTPSTGTGTIRFKDGNDVTYLGNLYTGVPLKLTGEKKSADSGLTMPKLEIGQNNVDLSQFKPLIYDENIDNAIVIRIRILLDNLVNNRSIRETHTYRVKRVESYTRTSIMLQLATLSDSLGFKLPYRTYVPPAFPSVQM